MDQRKQRRPWWMLIVPAIAAIFLAWFALGMAADVPTRIANPDPIPTTISDVVERRLPPGRVWVTVQGRALGPSFLIAGMRGRYTLHNEDRYLGIVVDPKDGRHAIVVRFAAPPAAGDSVTVTGRVNWMGSDWSAWASGNGADLQVASDLYIDDGSGEYPAVVVALVSLAAAFAALFIFGRALRRYLS